MSAEERFRHAPAQSVMSDDANRDDEWPDWTRADPDRHAAMLWRRERREREEGDG